MRTRFALLILLALAARPAHAGALLEVVPYTNEGVEMAHDIVDTLEYAWKLAVRDVERVPRNDAKPALIAAVLAESNVEIVWIRATRERVGGWLPQLERLAGVVVWTRPAILAQDPWGAEDDRVLEELARRADAVVAFEAARSDRAIAPFLHRFAVELRRGATVAAALDCAASAAEENPSWHRAGDAATRAELRRPNWLQRRLRGPRAERVAEIQEFSGCDGGG